MGDALGDAPIGVEIDRLDGGAHGRRLALGLAGDDAVPELDLMALDRFELEGGNVDQDVAILDPLLRQLAQPLQIDAQLREARLRGNVEGLQRRRVQPSGGPQPIVVLEAAHCGLQVLVPVPKSAGRLA